MMAEKKTETKSQLTSAGTVGGQGLELLIECLCVFAVLRLEARCRSRRVGCRRGGRGGWSDLGLGA